VAGQIRQETAEYFSMESSRRIPKNSYLSVMKYTMLLTLMILGCGNKEVETVDASQTQILEVACGECMFGLPGDDCDLAVRVDGKAYFVKGTHIDDHGDAHAGEGFCNAIRRAEVKGELINNIFQVTEFKLLAEAAE